MPTPPTELTLALVGASTLSGSHVNSAVIKVLFYQPVLPSFRFLLARLGEQALEKRNDLLYSGPASSLPPRTMKSHGSLYSLSTPPPSVTHSQQRGAYTHGIMSNPSGSGSATLSKRSWKSAISSVSNSRRDSFSSKSKKRELHTDLGSQFSMEERHPGYDERSPLVYNK